MADLVDGQYEISYLTRSLVFGKGTPITVEQLDLGASGTDTNDYRSPRADGTGFGRDYRAGRVLAWDGNILGRLTPAQRAAGMSSQRVVLDALETLETAWDAEEVRLEPEDVAVLRMRRGGRTRRVYGRPRRFEPTTGNTHQGWVPFSCDFQARDHFYYDDQEQSLGVSMVPAGVGGLVGDRIGPWVAAGAGAGISTMNVGGTKPAWTVIRIHGPVSGSLVDPVIEIVGQWKIQLLGSIAYDQFVVVDSTPWGRSIRRSDGANWSGKLSTVSRRPSGMRVPPGSHTVILTGVDSSLTAYATVYWRDTFASH